MAVVFDDRPHVLRSSLHGACLAAIFALGVQLVGLTERARAADDYSGQLRQTGLDATYTAGSLNIARREANATLRLAPGEVPDSRLPPTGWRARWQGVLEVVQPGKYQFAAHASGKLSLLVDQQLVLAHEAKSIAPAGVAVPPGMPVELAFGLHRIEILFEPTMPGAELKLYWQSDAFAREPIGARSVGHAVPESEIEALAGGALSPAQWLSTDNYLAGRLMVEEQSCVACHRPTAATPVADRLATRPGPKLTHAGDRLKLAWIYHWLGDPQALRPEAVMPRMFAAGRQGEIERRAVASFLASQADSQRTAPTALPADRAPLVAEGKQLFERAGCIACHRAAPDRPARATLRGLAEKTSPEVLAQFLEDPATVDPAGRMPNLALKPNEAVALAAFLTNATTEPIEPLSFPAAPHVDELQSAWTALGQSVDAFAELDPSRQLLELGRQVMHAKRCTTCHEFKESEQSDFWIARPAQTNFAQIIERAAAGKPAGCLAMPTETLLTEPPPKETAANDAPIVLRHPQFAPNLDRSLVLAFLAAARTAGGAAAPVEHAKLTLARFNCQACHERDGVGGLAPDFVNLLSTNQSAQEAELIKPPALSGVADKLLARSLKDVLTGDRRARPWMSLRMPHFGQSHVGELATELAAWDGVAPADAASLAEPDMQLAAAGRQLVGAEGFGCNKCHDLLGRSSGGTRGPDLALAPERIQYDWFERWMTDPQRIEPGTRMPTVFLKGESPYPNILDGDPALQRAAIWQYLLASRDLPLPTGLDPQATAAAPIGERVLVARTFLPDVSPRSMGIRFPSGVHLIYDAQGCRLAQAWRGEFLDMSPVWTERGGRQARLQGPVRWNSPVGFPWEISGTTLTELPSFVGRGTDTTLGATLPDDSKLHPSRVKFRGYHVDAAAATMRYDLQLADNGLASFTERLTTNSDEARGRVQRDFEVSTPKAALVVLNVADLAAAPTIIGPEQAASDGASILASALVSTTTDAGPAIYRLRAFPPDALWRLAVRDGRWNLLLQVPTVADALPQPAGAASPPARAAISLEVVLPTDATPAGTQRAIEAIGQEPRS